jgi:hypothetical protein
MSTQATSLPKRIPAFLEVIHDGFKSADDATVSDWPAAQSFERELWRRRAIARIVKVAGLVGVPDHVPLLPRLKVLAAGNITVIRRETSARNP